MVSSTKAQSVNYRSKTELCYGHEEKAETISHLGKLLRSLGIVGILSKFAIAFYKMPYFGVKTAKKPRCSLRLLRTFLKLRHLRSYFQARAQKVLRHDEA